MRFAFALPLLAAFAQPALAAPSAAEQFETAMDGIEARMARAGTSGALAQARRDSAVAAQFAAVRSAMERFDSPDFPLDFPDTMLSVCGRVQEVLSGYIGRPDMLKYEDEFTVLMVAGTSCMARHMPRFNEFWDGLNDRERKDGRASGITRMREGVDLVLVNVVALAGSGELTQSNARALAAAAADWSGMLGSIYSLSGRKALLKKIEDTTPAFARKFPEYSARMRAGLNDPACSTICRTL